jgi:HK97 gp10 family phage protein
MARGEFKMPEDFLQKISALGERTDEIVPRVLEAGGEVMLAKVKSNLQTVIGKSTKYDSRSTGELVEALGVSGARMDREGNYNVKVGFAEPRRDGESNAKLANILEYGKHGQPPKPFLKPAKSAAKGACIEAMKAKLEEEINNI